MPLGSEYNTVLVDKTWRILDNSGELVFSRSTRLRGDYPLDQIRCENDGLYVWSLNHQPTTVTVTELGASGKDAHAITVEPLMYAWVATSKDTAIVYGSNVFAEGKASLLSRIVAYSIVAGKQKMGQLPTYTSSMMRPLSRPQWRTLYLITNGDFREKDNPLTLIEYDKDLKETFARAISRKSQRLEFVCTDKDTIYLATTTPQGLWDFMYYEVKGRKLSDAPFLTPQSTWLNGLPFGDGKLVVWGEQGIMLYEPRVAMKRRPQMIQLPDPAGMRLAQKAGAVAEDGRFALAVHHRSEFPKEVLVYSKEGELLERIDVKEGFIEHLKFVAGGKELLVFATEYTARVQLNPSPATAPSTQPTTLPREPLQKVK